MKWGSSERKPPYIISHSLRYSDRLHNTSSAGSSIVIGYKNTISGGSSIMQPIRIPENTRNVILMMNLISTNFQSTLLEAYFLLQNKHSKNFKFKMEMIKI